MVHQPPFWSCSLEIALKELNASVNGLSQEEARRRLRSYGYNTLKNPISFPLFRLFASQFASPFILILILATALSLCLGDMIDALIIFVIVFISGIAGFLQEKSAQSAVSSLLEIVQVKATVLRETGCIELNIQEIVPGDIIHLSAGDIVPADLLLIDAHNLFVNEASFTGETASVEKIPGVVPEVATIQERSNYLLKGTNVVSGKAVALAVGTGRNTEFGKVVKNLHTTKPETGFERDVRLFSDLLMQLTLLFILAIFLFNIICDRPVMNAFLFSLALAIGVTPQLLPTIITVALSQGARKMAQKKAICKRLSSIHNLGAMDVLCVDKTGTLTKGVVELYKALNIDGGEDERLYTFGYLNAAFQTGYSNPIDKAILQHGACDVQNWRTLDEIPYDFIRKRISVLVQSTAERDEGYMITKGAFEEILQICSFAEDKNRGLIPLSHAKEKAYAQFNEWAGKGFRVLGLAYRKCSGISAITAKDEKEMVFKGILLFFDPPKPGIQERVKNFSQQGVALKMITGDSYLVASFIAQSIGLNNHHIIRGGDLHELSDEALTQKVKQVDLFAEVEPNQKERIIVALKRSGYTVGFLGDGVNDVVALHSADVGISVDSAVDAARQGADIVLLERDLSVLHNGVIEGRKTIINTMRYIFIATGANFGNILSMAGASLFLPFLPLLPKQILLTNLFADIPESTIVSDDVEQELLKQPTSWDLQLIKRFMALFGVISSLFDYAAFFIFLSLFGLNDAQFHTAWFIQSVISAALSILILRTTRSVFRSKPNWYMSISVLAVLAVSLILPWSFLSSMFEFVPLSFSLLMVIFLNVAIYLCTIERIKIWFHARYS